MHSSSLCFWCGPAVPSALPAPRWYLCRSALSRWRCADFVQYSGWRYSENLCPGAAMPSGTAGVSAKKTTVNDGRCGRTGRKKRKWNVTPPQTAILRYQSPQFDTHTLLVLWWIDAMMTSLHWQARGAKRRSRVLHVPLQLAQIPAVQAQLCTHSITVGGRRITQLCFHSL